VLGRLSRSGRLVGADQPPAVGELMQTEHYMSGQICDARHGLERLPLDFA
jgi:hypothetical protein